MKLVFKIARTELRNLFYSPVAWFLTIAFMVQCGIFYSAPLIPAANWQDVLLKNNPRFSGWRASLTQSIFLNGDGLFRNVLQNLYLFVPLLTMGIISREINNGTIKLLYSSPIKTRQIVFGKYLALLGYNFFLVLLAGIFLVAGAFNIRDVDYGILLSAALAFYLLMSAYAAIGMFMSTLSTYQIVSAISTFTLIFVLTRIGGLWQQYDFVRDLTYFLSIVGRTLHMLKGLITTNDVIYFLVIIYMFVAFTLFRLKGTREFKSAFWNAGRYVSVLVSALIIGYLSSRPSLIGYWDTTAQKVNTIHWRTQDIIAQMKDEPLEITLYTNLLGQGSSRGIPEARNEYLWNLWEPYIRFKPDIRFRYVYYYDVDETDSANYKMFPGKSLGEIANIMADAIGQDASLYRPPSEVRREVDLRPEGYRLVMRLKYKNRTTFLRTYYDSRFWPDEEHVAAAFKRLLLPQMPRVMFVSGNLERSIYKTGEREFWVHSRATSKRMALVNNGFDCDTINLDTEEIPDSISSLVLADPKTVLSDRSLKKIGGYISKGGNLLVFGEPGKQQIVNPVLRMFGARFMDGTLIQPSRHEMPHMVFPSMTAYYLGMSDEYLGQIALKGLPFGDTVRPLEQGAAPIEIGDSSGYEANTLLATNPGKVWLKAGALVVDSTMPDFNAASGDIRRESFITATALTKKVSGHEQRIVIFGDADWLSNIRAEGAWHGRTLYSWLDYGRFPIYTPRPTPKDDLLNITGAGADLLRKVFVWILPGLVLILGAVFLIRRKRK